MKSIFILFIGLLISTVLYSVEIHFNSNKVIYSNALNKTIKSNSFSMDLIPCMHCGDKFPNKNFVWWVCNKCGFRIDQKCISKHGKGFKCSKCSFGQIKRVQF
jgi:predicted RNA-binding Zn-ribbon protein involved in translation (DUF1610 family)